nr:FAD-dependent oxidoreductase [Thiomicrospira sp. WB1]
MRSDADVLIIGAGYAGWQAAEAIREAQPEASITMLTACDGAVYPKPALSMALSQGRDPSSLVEATAQEKAAELDMAVKTRTRVMSINAKRKKVTTTTGSFRYQKLILATGAQAMKPSLEGEAADAVMTLNDLAGYRKFREALADAQRVTVIGGGLIATEMAEDLISQGYGVQMLVRGANLMSQILPEAIAHTLANKLTAKGVEIAFHSQAERVDPIDQGYRITSDQGEHFDADLVLAAVGLKPNLGLAKKAKLDTGQGITINAHCQTSDPDVYALGDCAEADGVIQAFLEPIRRQAKALADHISQAQTGATFEVHPTLIKTKTPSLSIMLSPPLKATHGHWEQSALVGDNQQLYYRDQETVTGFALSGEFVNKASELYKTLVHEAA